MMNKVKKQAGFGLVETLIASTIIVSVIASFVFVSQGVLTATGRTADRLQATSLAAEGIEVVRQLRDTNWIDQDNNTDWGKWETSSLSQYVVPRKEYMTNFTDPSVPVAKRYFLTPVLAGQKIILNGATYNRTVKILSVSNPRVIMPSSSDLKQKQLLDLSYKVTSRVYSVDDPRIDITLSEIITNWRPNF